MSGAQSCASGLAFELHRAADLGPECLDLFWLMDAVGTRAGRRDLLRRRDVALPDRIETAQLGERLDGVVDAQRELGVVLARVDEEGGGLLAALVAAGTLAGFERGDEALGEGRLGVEPLLI